jgi:hypothetical protein
MFADRLSGPTRSDFQVRPEHPGEKAPGQNGRSPGWLRGIYFNEGN